MRICLGSNPRRFCLRHKICDASEFQKALEGDVALRTRIISDVPDDQQEIIASLLERWDTSPGNVDCMGDFVLT